MCNFLEYKGTFMLHIIAMFQAGVSKGSAVTGRRRIARDGIDKQTQKLYTDAMPRYSSSVQSHREITN